MKQLITSAFLRIRKTNILSNFINLSIVQASNAASQIVIFILIRRIIGLESFGEVMVASTFCAVASSVVNYGTNQSGIKDVAASTNRSGLSRVFTTAILLRVLIFAFFLVIVAALSLFTTRYDQLLLFSIPLVFSEVINPFFFFVGVEKLKAYNIGNLLAKIMAIAGVYFFVEGQADAYWVNFIMGLAGTAIFLCMLFFIYYRYNLRVILPTSSQLLFILKDNFYLTMNNLSIQLQQSIMVFALGKWAPPIVLGAYTFCDKLMIGARTLIVAISTSIYPRGVQLYKQAPKLWEMFRFRAKVLVGVIIITASTIVFLVPGQVIYLLTGANDPYSTEYLRAMAFLPAVVALNSVNVLDLLIRNKNLGIFRISITILVLAFIGAYFLVHHEYFIWIGYYTLGLEVIALLMYEVAIQKYRHK